MTQAAQARKRVIDSQIHAETSKSQTKEASHRPAQVRRIEGPAGRTRRSSGAARSRKKRPATAFAGPSRWAFWPLWCWSAAFLFFGLVPLPFGTSGRRLALSRDWLSVLRLCLFVCICPSAGVGGGKHQNKFTRALFLIWIARFDRMRISEYLKTHVLRTKYCSDPTKPLATTSTGHPADCIQKDR